MGWMFLKVVGSGGLGFRICIEGYLKGRTNDLYNSILIYI